MNPFTKLSYHLKLETLILVVNLLVYGAITRYISLRLQPMGDAPHYLLIAHSLVFDGDVDMRNNYEQQDYLNFIGYDLEPHAHSFVPDGSFRSVHNIGLAILISPFYLLGGFLGTVVFTAILSALLAVQIFSACYDLTKDYSSSLVTWAITSFSFPILPWVSQIYTEIPTALFILLCLRLIYHLDRTNLPLEIPLLIIIGNLISFLPWLHVKYLLVAGGLFGLACIRLTKLRQPQLLQWLSLIAPCAVAGALFIFCFQRWYGNGLPTAQYKGSDLISFGQIGTAFLAWFLDQEYGLLWYAPVYILSIPGLFYWGRSHRNSLLAGAVVSGLVFVPNLLLSSPGWWGGYTFPCRLLIPALPFLCVSLAFFLRACGRQWVVHLISVALVLAGLAVEVYLIQTPRLLLNDADGTNNFFTALQMPFDSYLPSFVPQSRVGYTWIRQAEHMLGSIGQVEADYNASGGLSRHAHVGEAGVLMYGERNTVQQTIARRGQYRACFWLKTEDDTQTYAAQIRVIATQDGRREKLLAQADVKADQFFSTHDYIPVELTFNNPGMVALDFQVISQPGSSVWVDRVEFQLISPAHAPNPFSSTPTGS